MSRVLVTGAAGFIGRHLVERLIVEGSRVRCLVHHPGQAGVFAAMDVETTIGDITRPQTIERAVRQTDVVNHLAGRKLAFSAAEFFRVNEVGTRHVAPVSHYGRSKLAAETALQRMAGRLPVTVIRPPGVWGPRETYMPGLFRAIKRGVCVLPGRPQATLSLIDVRDLVEALLLAAERGRRLCPDPRDAEAASQGIYYTAARETPTFAELGEWIARAVGRCSVRMVHAPRAVGFALAAGAEIWSRLQGRPRLLNLDKMREAAAGSQTCDPGRAQRELGFKTVATLPERLRQTADWYQEHGWL